MFCTDSANIFINPRPACCETGKGGEGEKDTDRTVKGVPPCAHSLQYFTRQVERGAEESPPPPHSHTPFFDQFEAEAVVL